MSLFYNANSACDNLRRLHQLDALDLIYLETQWNWPTRAQLLHDIAQPHMVQSFSRRPAICFVLSLSHPLFFPCRFKISGSKFTAVRFIGKNCQSCVLFAEDENEWARKENENEWAEIELVIRKCAKVSLSSLFFVYLSSSFRPPFHTFPPSFKLIIHPSSFFTLYTVLRYRANHKWSFTSTLYIAIKMLFFLFYFTRRQLFLSILIN